MIFGIGIDLVEIKRIKQIIARNERFIAKILTDNEINLCPTNVAKKAEFVAGRFAAKEAVVKAMGTGIGGSVSWKDIEILKLDSGKPYIVINNKSILNEKFKLHISISHTKNLALAKVIIEY